MNTTAEVISFVALALLTLVPAVLVVTLRNLIHAALCLGVSFVGVAGLYLLLNAEFIAAAQVLVYVGAITVLILFAIMLTQGLTGTTFGGPTHSQWPIGLATAGVMMVLLGTFLMRQPWPLQTDPGIVANTPQVLGIQLLTTYIIPFEVASIVLLAALVAAIVLASGEEVVPVQHINEIYDDQDPAHGPAAEVRL
ncbi:MAG TPA: NADH-quinone oxidoreductase subunit J [Armatimonadota bacterium]|jgi:NAD(P)H-quinone oxidoreductase subunit 6